LRHHENICRLLYVGWERRKGPTYKQKLNLPVDIAIGVAALHHVNIAHGDLKPANLLVNDHPERQIVGQIADFGGSLDLDSDQKTPTMKTTLWSAPEVSIGEPEIDWRRADIWTCGLIIASIWSHVPSDQRMISSCYLDKIISEYLDGDLKNARLQLLKTEPDRGPGSLISRCKSSFGNLSQVFNNTLSCKAPLRKDMKDLIAEDLEP
jgi:serine/threonine protein kinase